MSLKNWKVTRAAQPRTTLSLPDENSIGKRFAPPLQNFLDSPEWGSSSPVAEVAHIKQNKSNKGQHMSNRKLGVRAARMELHFALVEGDQKRIEMAEKQLQEALAEAERKRQESEKNKDQGGDT